MATLPLPPTIDWRRSRYPPLPHRITPMVVLLNCCSLCVVQDVWTGGGGRGELTGWRFELDPDVRPDVPGRTTLYDGRFRTHTLPCSSHTPATLRRSHAYTCMPAATHLHRTLPDPTALFRHLIPLLWKKMPWRLALQLIPGGKMSVMDTAARALPFCAPSRNVGDDGGDCGMGDTCAYAIAPPGTAALYGLPT